METSTFSHVYNDDDSPSFFSVPLISCLNIPTIICAGIIRKFLLKGNKEEKHEKVTIIYSESVIINGDIYIGDEKKPITVDDIPISEKHSDINQETRLRNSYNKLIELKWIDSKTRVEDFLWVFDKDSVEEKPKDFKRIRWTKISKNKRINKTSLIYLCRLVFDYSNKDIDDKFFIWAEERFDFDIPMRANNKGFDNIPEEILAVY